MIKNVVMAALMLMFALPAYGAMPFPDKSGDEVLQSMINETVPKFQQLTYKS